MKFNINIKILPATRFVLLKLTTVAHSSSFKSFFVYCSFSIIGPYIHLAVSAMPSIVFQGLTLWFPTFTFAKGQTWSLKSGEFNPR